VLFDRAGHANADLIARGGAMLQLHALQFASDEGLMPKIVGALATCGMFRSGLVSLDFCLNSDISP